ncbi:hypothetical protein ACIQNU_03320 [Streptomyces sp. NPDC091292]|uniref:hypothetical protein n=1 Tax=Streptomyces sp. NPDC091292 TaxID=3365991 RepID=UPI0037FC5EC6
MAERRLVFRLIGRDDLSDPLRRAGDGADNMARRVTRAADDSDAAVNRFTRDANGRLHDTRGRFIATGDAARRMADDVDTSARRSSGILGRLRGIVGDVGDRARTSMSSLGTTASSGLTGSLYAVGGAAALSVLPALGALLPMLLGVAGGAVVAKMAFAGVGEAVALAGDDQEKYAETLAKMSAPQREFTKALVSAKKEFGGIAKEVQAAALPGFTEAVEAAGPVIRDMRGWLKGMAAGMGEAARGAGRLMNDGGFRKDLAANLKLGTKFVRDMTGALGPFTRAWFDFGAASKPTLTAFSEGISGLLSKGLPGLFQGLKSGISGSGQMFTGLFNFLNEFLAALGEFSGKVADAAGPSLREMFESLGDVASHAMRLVGDAIRFAKPLFGEAGAAARIMATAFEVVATVGRDVAGALISAVWPSFRKAEDAKGPLQRLSGWFKENRGAVLEFGRAASNGILLMSEAAIRNLPNVIKGFRLMTTGILTALDGIVSGAAMTFGWIPGIGGKLKAANREFDKFKDGFITGLHDAEASSRHFADTAGPRLSRHRLQMNIDNWNQQADAAKAKLKTVPPEKQAKLRAEISDLQKKVRDARGELASVKDKDVSLFARDKASKVARDIRAAIDRIRSKSVTLTTVRHTINVEATAARNAKNYRAQGGPAPKFAGGGMPGGLLNGPGTGTSDSIPMWWASTGEYVVNARSTAKYGPLIEAINSDSLGGGNSTAGLDVGKGLVKGMGDSTSGVETAARLMAAGVTAGIRAELEIASPSKKTAALAKDIGAGLIKGLTGSRDKIKATAADLAKDIRTAFSGRKESGLIRMVTRETAKLQDLASKRDKIAATIARAKEFAETTRVGAKKSAALGTMFESEEQVTAAGIQQKLAAKLAKMKTFTSYVKTLASRGLNKTMLREILEMGPEEGYAYASALVGANSKIFKEINSTQYKVNAQAESLGKIGADRLYDSGKNAGKGFLKGLDSQQDAIEKQMVKIAKGMEKAIKKALGIKSPSTVMAQLGQYSTEGLAVGLTGGMPVLDRALGAVTDRVAATRPVLGRPAAPGASGGQPVRIDIHVSGSSDPVAVARELRRQLVQLKRTYGVNVDLGVA